MRLTRSDNVCTAWVGWRLACDREDTQSVSIARGIQRRQTNELTSIAGYSARERSSVAAMAGNVLVYELVVRRKLAKSQKGRAKRREEGTERRWVWLNQLMPVNATVVLGRRAATERERKSDRERE